MDVLNYLKMLDVDLKERTKSDYSVLGTTQSETEYMYFKGKGDATSEIRKLVECILNDDENGFKQLLSCTDALYPDGIVKGDYAINIDK